MVTRFESYASATNVTESPKKTLDGELVNRTPRALAPVPTYLMTRSAGGFGTLAASPAPRSARVEDHVAERVLQVERQSNCCEEPLIGTLRSRLSVFLRRGRKVHRRVEHGGAAARQRDVNVTVLTFTSRTARWLKTGRNARRPWRSSGPVDSP